MNQDYRKKCQVFTPKEIVKQLLDWSGYTKDLYGKKIMENSFGKGNILKEIIKRYIEDSLENHIDIDNIRIGLENDIYGIEWDKEKYNECIKELNKITKTYKIDLVKWKNLYHGDTLKLNIKEKFDFVIGNPPYINYRLLTDNDRNYIREKFNTCKDGKFDYCYAFIEQSVKSLKNNGEMGYLIPSSIFKNVFATNLREYIKPHIEKIYDYTTTKLFDENSNDEGSERLTSSIIMILKKNNNSNVIEYKDVNKNQKIIINKNFLGKKWIFSNDKIATENKTKFSDYFFASNTIATLYNKAYVINEYTEDDIYIYPTEYKNDKIEKEIIRDTISPKNFDKNINPKIIFPYQYKNGQLERYKKEEFERKFQGATNYLKNNFSEELRDRASDENAEWFEYGRSQALRNSNQRKLLLSTVITNQVKTKILSEKNIPYSGIYIISKGERTLEEAQRILQSDGFKDYISKIGIHASGESLRITAKDINEYML